jgi:hypothetical protein
MKVKSWVVLFVLLVFTAIGCEGVQVFKADFQSDTLGSQPSLSPDGPPTGDSIVIVGPGSTRVMEWLGQTGTRAAEIASVPVGFSGMELFVAPGIKGSRYFLSFNMYSKYLNTARDFYLRARSNYFGFGLLAEMKFRSGSIYVNNGLGFQLLDSIDYSTEENLLVMMNIDYVSETYYVSVVNYSTNVSQSITDIPLINDGGGSSEPFFQVGYDGDYGSGLAGMFLTDNYNISKVEP